MTVSEAIFTLNAAVFACEIAGFNSETVKMVEDALDTIKDALKAQEPRVLTLEEVIALKENTPVYIEDSNGYHGWDVYVGIDPVDNDITTGTPWSSSEYWPQSSYLDAWRCWTSRPTDKQRKAVKWE